MTFTKVDLGRVYKQWIRPVAHIGLYSAPLAIVLGWWSGQWQLTMLWLGIALLVLSYHVQVTREHRGEWQGSNFFQVIAASAAFNAFFQAHSPLPLLLFVPAVICFELAIHDARHASLLPMRRGFGITTALVTAPLAFWLGLR